MNKTPLLTHKDEPMIRFLFTCKGRATRLQWWAIFLGTYLLIGLFYILGEYARTRMESPVVTVQTAAEIGLWACLLSLFFCVYIFIAVSIKRLHDMNGTGWYLLLLLTPLFNFVLLCFLGFARGTQGENRFD